MLAVLTQGRRSMSHVKFPKSTNEPTSTPNYLNESDRTNIAFTSSIAAIAAINTIGLLLTATQCEGGGKHCYEMDVSCIGFTMACIWAVAGGLIGQTATLPRGSRCHFTSNKEHVNFQKTLVGIASSCSALALQTLSKFTISLFRCAEKQRQDGISRSCTGYETDISLNLAFMVGLLAFLAINSPPLRK